MLIISVFILLSALMGNYFAMPNGPALDDSDGENFFDDDFVHPPMYMNSAKVMAKAKAETWTLEGFKPGDKVLLVESPSVYRADRTSFFRGTPATVVGPSVGGHPEKMSIDLHQFQYLDETDEMFKFTRAFSTVTVNPDQVCHVKDWDALLAGKFPRFSVATVKYDVYFPEYERTLKAGERVIVLSEYLKKHLNHDEGTLTGTLYVRRVCTESGATTNQDDSCFDYVPADCLELRPRKKKHAICVNCGVQKLKRKMKVCDRCRDPCYCGKECQGVHWTVQHKYECTKPEKAKSSKTKAKGKAEL